MGKKRQNTSQAKPSGQPVQVTAPGPAISVRLTKGERIFIWGMTILAAFLILCNLGNTYLWSDEAHTALLGKTILSHGVPKGTDGFNSYSVDPSGSNSDMDKSGTWIVTPWLPYYLVAPLTLLPTQDTEWLLRLPFALFGIFTVPLVYFLSRRFFGRETAIVSVVFLVLCVPFLLYSRQCRYYSMAMFFSVWLVLGYDKFLKNEKGWLPHVFLSQLFLFHTNYMIWAGLGAGIALHFFLMAFDKKRLENAFFVAVYAAFFHLPWIFMFATKASRDVASAGKFAENLRNFLIGINNHLLPLGFLLTALTFVWFSRKKSSGPPAKSAALLAILMATNLAAVCFSTGYFFRYLVGVIPAVLILAAFLWMKIFKRQKAAGIIIAALLIGTNLFALPVESFFKLTVWDDGGQPLFRFQLWNYLYEITHEYRGPIRGIVDYLRINARDGQKVAIPYGDLPLKYYLPKLRIVGGMTGENLTKEAAAEADWIILRHYTMLAVKEVSDYILANVNMDDYEKVEIDFPDYTFENIPEPEMHLFRTATDMQKVLILKKR